ncbi:lytic transglycosylase domain-containing protein [Clostridium botulinum]|nr:lytic transglycosylase domain-containing protein [Clostridium botulinum]
MKKIFITLGIIGALLIGTGVCARSVLYPLNNKDNIQKYSKEYNVKPEVIAAVIHFETGFKSTPYKEGHKVGLMNIKDTEGIEMSKKIGLNITDPKDIASDDVNIQIGTWYISHNGGDSNLDDMMGKWVLRNNDEKDEEQMVAYAKQYYGEKIEKRVKIYKILYPELKF